MSQDNRTRERTLTGARPGSTIFFQEVSMTIILNEPRLPADVSERILKAHQGHRAAEETRVTSRLRELHARYRSERLKLISPAAEAKLREYSAANRLLPLARLNVDERSRSRAAALALAREQGVDLAALTGLRSDTQHQFDTIVNPHSTSYGELTDVPDGQASMAIQPLAVTYTFGPPWHGSWDQGSWWSTTDPGSTTWINQIPSHWDSAGSRVGSYIGFNRRPSDNDDSASITHSSGMMVQFTMPHTTGLEISIGLTRLFGNHFIDTDDEFGASSCDVRVTESAVAEVYWDWNDWTADSHVERVLTQSVANRPEQWVDTNPIPVNQFHSRTLYNPNIVFPSGQTVVVYAGVQLSASAWVDDVSVRASVNSAWFVNWITITPRP